MYFLLLYPLGQTIEIQLDDFGYANVSPYFLDGGTEEPCLVEIQSNIQDFYCENVGDNEVVLTYIDIAGNTATTTAHVIIQDISAPNAVCQNINISLNNAGHATISANDLDGGSSDACGIAGFEASQTEFDFNNTGDNIVTLTVTDINGNISVCDATVTIASAPVAVCQNTVIALSGGAATINPADIDGGSTGYSDMTVSPPV